MEFMTFGEMISKHDVVIRRLKVLDLPSTRELLASVYGVTSSTATNAMHSCILLCLLDNGSGAMVYQ